MTLNTAAANKMPRLAPGEFRFISKALGIEPPAEDGKRRFKMVASSTVVDQGGDEIKMSALEDLRRAFAGGLNIFTDHEHRVDNVFGRTDVADIRASGEKDPKTGQPIYDLHIAGVVNTPNPRMNQLADSIDSGLVVFGASIGARLGEHKKNEQGGYDIFHLEGKEASLVGIPMNQRSWTYKAAKAAQALDAVGDDFEDEDEPEEIEKADMSSATRNKLPDSEFACPEQRKYPINDAAHVRAALSRVADPSNDQCGKDKIIAAARRMGIGDHKGLGDEDLVLWASIEYPSVQIEKDDNGEEVFIVKALDTGEGDPLVRQDLAGPKKKKGMCPDCGKGHDEGGDCPNDYHTKSSDEEDIHTAAEADGQESEEAPPETPETASETEDVETDPAPEEQMALAFEASDVLELANHVRELVVLLKGRDDEITELRAENERVTAESEEAKQLIARIVALPLRRKAVADTTNFSKRLPDYLAPEVKAYLTKSAGDRK